MKISLLAKDLDAALAAAKHATPARASMVAYSAVLLETAEDQLAALGSDGETSITGYAPATVEEAGSSLVQPRPLSEWLRTVAGDAMLALVDAGDGDLTVSAGGGEAYRFRTVSTTFPKPSKVLGEECDVDLSELALAMAAVRSSSGTGGLVQMVSTESELRLNTTDTYRLSQAVVPGAGWGDFSGIIPLSMLERVAGGAVDTVVVDQKGRIIEFSSPQTCYSARLSSAPFPAVDSVLSSVPTAQVHIPLSELKTALSRLNAIADEEALHCDITSGSLRLSVPSSPLGSGAEIVSLAGGEDFSFAINLSYLREALAARSGETVTLAYSSPIQPLFLVSSEPLLVTTAIMPVRI